MVNCRLALQHNQKMNVKNDKKDFLGNNHIMIFEMEFFAKYGERVIKSLVTERVPDSEIGAFIETIIPLALYAFFPIFISFYYLNFIQLHNSNLDIVYATKILSSLVLTII